ncbi:MAG: putative peptidoglycan lipid flippase [Chloroflexota bacterium]|jgi:putative peptidoglycan lipid II flippase|nr:putative peptidoglycan lipid flippase [Chloroflexota bacterium]
MDPAVIDPEAPPSAPAPRWARARALLGAILPRGAMVLSVLTLGGYAMGLVRDRMFARTFGAGPELDAYNAAFVLPELALDVLVAGGLVAPFVPVFIGLRTEASEAARAFARTILTLAIGVMALAAVLLFVFAPQTVDLIAPGFDAEHRQLYVELFRVMCVTSVIFAASIVLGEILVAERRFLTYGLAPLFYNGGIVLGTVLLASRIGIFAAAVGAVVGALGHLGIRLVGISRTSFRPRPSLDVRAAGVGAFLRLMLPKMVSHPIEPLTFLYFTALASTLAPGSVSSVSFARNFQSVPVSLIGASFAIAAFPALSAAAAVGDRRGFSRVFGANLARIGLYSTVAAIGLFLFGGLAIRVLLGGGAFDEEDTLRTTGILAVFAISIPLESLTHLLSRGLYATRNTLLPTLASVSGFVATVLGAQALAPRIGLAAIPAAFALGMGVKVAILGAALVPRMARIGRARTRSQQAHPVAPSASRRGWPVRRRLGQAVLVLALAMLSIGAVLATGEALKGASITVAPAVTPWVRQNAPAVVPSVPPLPSSGPLGSGGSGSSPGAAASPGAGSSTPPSPTPKPGPFAMDLYQKGDFVGEFKDIWCLPAAMQTSMNIMDAGADVSNATQARLFNLARSIDPAPDGAAEPEAWAKGLTQLGYGDYEVSIQPSIKAAIKLAAKQIRLTNRPAGLMTWRGAHSWVMSGFNASADPAVTDQYTVTGVRIEDVWYPRFSTLWGYSRKPDALVAVGDLPEDFLPWKRPLGSYPKKDGNFVIVIPVQ